MKAVRNRTTGEEWLRLPGLFSWDEVYALFRAEAGHGDGWRFSVRRASTDDRAEPLYTVLAALRPRSQKGQER